MNILIKNFGNMLISRLNGHEDFLKAKAYLFNNFEPSDDIILDFDGVKVMTPSWLDEFIKGIKKEYNSKIICVNTDNPTVERSLEFSTPIN